MVTYTDSGGGQAHWPRKILSWAGKATGACKTRTIYRTQTLKKLLGHLEEEVCLWPIRRFTVLVPAVFYWLDDSCNVMEVLACHVNMTC